MDHGRRKVATLPNNVLLIRPLEYDAWGALCCLA
jgi:hypothetical protein